jgi:hypothetical protein
MSMLKSLKLPTFFIFSYNTSHGKKKIDEDFKSDLCETRTILFIFL